MIEGGSSNRVAARLVAYEMPAWFSGLIEALVEESVDYLCAQIEAGAEVVQIFDSWAGDLPASLRTRWVDEPLATMTRKLRARHPHVQVIVFARGCGIAHLEIARATQCQGIGIEAELSMTWAAAELSETCAVQGNLDPVALLASEERLREETLGVVRSISADRHIFNQGHGVRPETDPQRLAAVIETVRSFDRTQGYA